MATVSIERVSKRYGRAGPEVVRGVTLEVADGEFVTLVGPSGCGKSTLLNLVAGLEDVTSGEIRIGGESVTGLSPKARDVAMVFQNYALYPHMDVRRNIGFPLKVAGVAAGDIERRVAETAERLGIGPLLARKPAELSGGQRQRVALGRALVRRPKVFLFDEPLSNLDAALRAQLRAELKKLHEELGATFVYVTHDQAEAMTLSGRVAVMSAGEIRQVGPPREVYARPDSVFVAEFFGSPKINVAPPRAFGLAHARGDEVLAGARPEDVEVGTGDAPAGAVAGRVYLVEPMGAESWVTVEVAGARVIARAPGGFEAASGAAAWVRVEPARALWFDKDSGLRVP